MVERRAQVLMAVFFAAVVHLINPGLKVVVDEGTFFK